MWNINTHTHTYSIFYFKITKRWYIFIQSRTIDIIHYNKIWSTMFWSTKSKAVLMDISGSVITCMLLTKDAPIFVCAIYICVWFVMVMCYVVSSMFYFYKYLISVHVVIPDILNHFSFSTLLFRFPSHTVCIKFVCMYIC